ncbi:MAG TPA: hypothetical protein PLX20_10860 [Rhodocyclaceae bacterium]|nr:hypothetical protein [Rhodocyclaceae bacterium]HMV52329.1 hypothetical protein [Rhodocyclaceae bacterium]HNA02967.1 hypothetical protein [Rhodocyclaceae bacterium]HNH13628.1 hypothetical protein [Rhodocyclaceae bacterium]HNH98753.1 hypothetical protein [Rhodocyclaceae bacterium]
MNNTIRRLFVAVALCLLAAAVYVSVFRGPGSPFDRQAWNDARSMEGEIRCLRGRMLRDLRERVIRPGMTRQAITDQLGNPDAERNGEMAYGLGFCAGPGETSSLIIHLDNRGLVTHTSLVGL